MGLVRLMVQWLRVLVALPVDKSLVHSSQLLTIPVPENPTQASSPHRYLYTCGINSPRNTHK